MRRLSWIVTLPLALVFVVFAVANRHGVEINLWPFALAVQLPVFLLALGTLAIGAILGATLVWLPSLAWRRRAAKRQRRIDALETELAEARSAAAGTTIVATPVSTSALPPAA